MVSEARYDAVADWYGDEDDRSWPATRSLLGMVGPVRGLRAVDLACGHGPIARQLAHDGATVVGVDISGRLLARARAAEPMDRPSITYLQADVSAPETLRGRTFDVATCHFGLTDIDDLDGALATVARILTPGGAFVCSILHPCFPGFGETSGSWPTGGTYWDEGWWLADGSRSFLRRRVGAHHRTLSTYFDTLSRHGLSITALEEPRPSREWTAGRPEASRFPLYLVLRCRKEESQPPGRWLNHMYASGRTMPDASTTDRRSTAAQPPSKGPARPAPPRG